jgi:hypothetical protein
MKQNKQRTVLVVYTYEKLTKRAAQTSKRYAFNTASDVRVGMHLKTDAYDTPIQIVEVMPKAYKYIDVFSGALSDRRAPTTKQYEIREIEVIDKRPGSIIKASLYDEEIEEECEPYEKDE